MRLLENWFGIIASGLKRCRPWIIRMKVAALTDEDLRNFMLTLYRALMMVAAWIAKHYKLRT